MYCWSFRTLINVLGSPIFSLLRGRLPNLNKDWPSYQCFKFLSYELHWWRKKYFWSFRTLSNVLGSPIFSVFRGQIRNLQTISNKLWVFLVFVLRTAFLRWRIWEPIRAPQASPLWSLKNTVSFKNSSPTSENLVWFFYWLPQPLHQSEERRENFFIRIFFRNFFYKKKKIFFSIFISVHVSLRLHTRYKKPHWKSHTLHTLHMLQHY